MGAAPTKAELAVAHTLRAIREDGRKAYLLGYGTETFRLLTDAHAERFGEDPDAFRENFWKQCRPERVVTPSEDERT